MSYLTQVVPNLPISSAVQIGLIALEASVPQILIIFFSPNMI